MNFCKIFLVLSLALPTLAQDEAQETTKDVSTGFKTNRNYPGGRDEEDLRVQKEIAVDPPKVERRSIEESALKTYFKTEDKAKPSPTKAN